MVCRQSWESYFPTGTKGHPKSRQSIGGMQRCGEETSSLLRPEAAYVAQVSPFQMHGFLTLSPPGLE